MDEVIHYWWSIPRVSIAKVGSCVNVFPLAFVHTRRGSTTHRSPSGGAPDHTSLLAVSGTMVTARSNSAPSPILSTYQIVEFAVRAPRRPARPARWTESTSSSSETAVDSRRVRRLEYPRSESRASVNQIARVACRCRSDGGAHGRFTASTARRTAAFSATSWTRTTSTPRSAARAVVARVGGRRSPGPAPTRSNIDLCEWPTST